ncbi:P-loop containing nucleoside triphosphate hydrolase protein [Rickenella mellea]|uniref:P-loop containing nucleoside triphosphate hydrolase protein n=1 Tax=Rickenella mellea TaxID=50990 RepID=A0A4Y7PNR7_9AGAM|nr:P-loop containing nucleoside triphosphate hydrolase protein [Rickenella mellea]
MMYESCPPPHSPPPRIPPNMFCGSQSRTGKTAAFVLTMLNRVDVSKTKPQVLCGTLYRELARQIMAVVPHLRADYAIKTERRVHDTFSSHIIVGTSGTMADYIKQKILDVSEVKILVLDEAGNRKISEKCVRTKHMLPRQHPTQIVLFSSTFPNHVRTLVSRVAPNAHEVELKKG